MSVKLGTDGLVDNNGDTVFAHGHFVPQDGVTGYAQGCLFIDTDSAVVLQNKGDKSACNFDELTAGTSGGLLDGDNFHTDTALGSHYSMAIGETCFSKGGTAQRSFFLGELVADGQVINAGVDNMEGCDNTLIGTAIGRNMVSPARRNVGIGSYCLEAVTVGYANIAIGYRPLTSITSGSCNVGIADGAMMAATDSFNCTCVGVEAGLSIGHVTQTRDVTCYGYHAGYGGPPGGDGSQIWDNASGSWSTWVGSSAGGALRADSTHANTVAVGAQAGYQGGANCVYIGYNAGRSNVTDNRFFLDALDRSGEANEQTKSMMYGTFAVAPENQTLRVNAQLIPGVSINHLDGVRTYYGTDNDASIYDSGTGFYIDSGAHSMFVMSTPYFKSGAARIQPDSGNAILYITGGGTSGFDITNDTAGDTYIYNRTSGKNIYWYTSGTQRMIVGTAGLTLSDAQNLVVQTTTGTKIGTATGQKLGFWNATPIVQPTTSVAEAAFVQGTGDAVNDNSTFGGYTLAQVVKALQLAGLLA